VNRYQERIQGYPEGIGKYHTQHLKSLVSKLFAESKNGRYLLNDITDWDERLNSVSIVAIFKALQSRDVTHRLGEFQIPVLVINGEFNNALSQGREMAQKIRGAVHKVIPGAGHACCLEDPSAFD